ncbi:hypothetical protein MOMUL_06070 [Moorella mulderi DSM 14980]|uniref:Uncharacterized protein n=1 Tax=Moorella mulderi DSM 14980 TaxID=1122241 RepID=A0A151B1T5_9FIRM|nr:hypothetical protein MOMUL_06070 [Moorella mulderi DSM 14980]
MLYYNRKSPCGGSVTGSTSIGNSGGEVSGWGTLLGSGASRGQPGESMRLTSLLHLPFLCYCARQARGLYYARKSRLDRASSRLVIFPDHALKSVARSILAQVPVNAILLRDTNKLFRMFLYPLGVLRLPGHAALDGGFSHSCRHRRCHPEVKGLRHDEIG